MFDYDLIDPRCPRIDAGNWEECNSKGWRWLAPNLKATLVPQNEHYVYKLQYEHGLTSVTVGVSWSTNRMMPVKDPEWIGVYVRDIPEKVHRFMAELHMWWDTLTPKE